MTDETASNRVSDLDGMTVNERLFTLGLLDRFDAAVRARDREVMTDLLAQCAISRLDAEAIAETVLRSPKKYGF
jgi:hypothetical protein